MNDPYLALTAGVRNLTGIDLDQYKRPQMERRIRSWARSRYGDENLTELLALLQADKNALDAFLDRVTINVSQLWRNPEQWQRIADHVLPALAETGKIRCWSAGSSYGAEAFTLAALLWDRGLRAPDASVLGTDIDPRMVDRARSGRFTAADARDVPSGDLAAHFDAEEGGYVVKDYLKTLVRFETGDLLAIQPRAASFDLVLCRNTVIYFTEPVRDELHRRLVSALRPGGFLIVGSTERVSDPARLGLSTPFPFTYRKDD